ncbi:MAG: hypothetical protein K6L73_14955 [Cellvibrionaceae bacterium]
MKLVRDFTEEELAINFSRKLRSKGIANHVAMFRGNNTFKYGGGPKTWAVWVLLESQHSDALKLIKGARHVVENPLTEEEILELEMRLGKAAKNKILRELGLFVVLFVGAILLVIYSVTSNA